MRLVAPLMMQSGYMAAGVRKRGEGWMPKGAGVIGKAGVGGMTGGRRTRGTRRQSQTRSRACGPGGLEGGELRLDGSSRDRQLTLEHLHSTKDTTTAPTPQPAISQTEPVELRRQPNSRASSTLSNIRDGLPETSFRTGPNLALPSYRHYTSVTNGYVPLPQQLVDTYTS
ncbi:uncharacterized protein PV09_08284 [Verruconis gallopava]|uniref:Uncharacterized protein n=1 Tax=Verruconis gallopava TaxID=253628 RepID=A0A0D2A0E6_9PEZI|nr:uncharacterized protein PV09_08284 [Verruconis gallopava]KIW00098.1 hypothetical protein PV09_08284 [Verruconis gallopava]